MRPTGQPVVYPSVGHCIYCGAGDRTLTDEHIIPYGLGGNVILKKSSCRQCATITSKFEQACLRRTFGALRLRAGFPSRNKKKRKQNTLPIRMIGPDGIPREHYAKVEDLPAMFGVPRFCPPGILRGLPPESVFRDATGWICISDEDYFRERMERYGDKGMQIGSMNPGLFGRMLAKIGHSAVVAIRGENSFRPALLDLVLHDKGSAPYLVGGDFDVPDAEHRLHRLDVHVYTHRGTAYLIATMRLLANFGTPVYHVVVGEWIGDDEGA